MVENIQGRLKVEFPCYNCFPTITKLIAGFHALYASKSKANVVVVLKDKYFDASYLYSFHMRYIKRISVKI